MKAEDVKAGVYTQYDVVFDVMYLNKDFDVDNWYHQSSLIHESTHAYIDKLNLGKQDTFAFEGVAYVAQQLFVKASGQSPISGKLLFDVARDIADALFVPGAYEVPDKEAERLMSAVASEPTYQAEDKKGVVSNAFNRGAVKGWFHAMSPDTF
jgi:hypothetical protein